MKEVIDWTLYYSPNYGHSKVYALMLILSVVASVSLVGHFIKHYYTVTHLNIPEKADQDKAKANRVFILYELKIAIFGVFILGLPLIAIFGKVAYDEYDYEVWSLGSHIKVCQLPSFEFKECMDSYGHQLNETDKQ